MDLPQAKCPHCGSLNPGDAFFCSECGGQVRSLMGSEQGPVDEVDGDFEIKPLFADPAPPPPPAVLTQPPPPPPSAVAPPAASGQAAEDEAPPAPAGPPPPFSAKPPPPSAAVRKLLTQSPAASPDSRPRPPGQYSGALITPPPTPTGGPYQPPPSGGQPYQPPGYQDPYGQPSGGYGQPGGYPPTMAPGYGTYSENTSGSGSGYAMPVEAGRSTYAGCVPFGIFAFANQMTTWGVLGLLAGFIPYVGGILGLVYIFQMYLNGRKLAWQSRRFDSVEQFEQTMNTWSNWGLGYLAVSIALGILVAIAMFASEGNY